MDSGIKSLRKLLHGAAFALLCACLTTSAVAANESAQDVKHGDMEKKEWGLSKLAFAIGAYEGETQMDDGRTYRVRVLNEWWLGDKSIIGQSWDAYGDDDWKPFYKGFQAWHGGRKQIEFNSVSRTGEFVSGHIDVGLGPIVQWHWTVVDQKGNKLVGRDTWKFNDAKTQFLWTFAKRVESDKYEPYFEILMKRKE